MVVPVNHFIAFSYSVGPVTVKYSSLSSIIASFCGHDSNSVSTKEVPILNLPRWLFK